MNTFYNYFSYFCLGFDESPWWEDTLAILIYHKEIDKTILYGELIPSHDLKCNDEVKAGSIIGNVKRVLKKDKGKPMTMLHIEMYDGIVSESVWWNLGKEKPSKLADITPLLKEIYITERKTHLSRSVGG